VSGGDGRARPVTLADVARDAGTSVSTAARALNGRGYVSPRRRERLLAAADRLGYVPNASARTLKQRTSRVVGVLVSDVGSDFGARLAAGIEQTLREADYRMVLASDDGDRRQQLHGARALLAMRPAGVILTPVDPAPAALLARHGVDVVEVDVAPADGARDGVALDNERGAREATVYLLANGHRRIALLVGDDEARDAARLRGFRAAHEAAAVAADEDLIARIGSDALGVDARIAGLLDEERPSALFAATGPLAQRAWQVFRARGIRPPQAVSFVAFDDAPWMQMVEPGVTAVALPTQELGRRAARLALRRADDPTRPPTSDLVEPTLVVRGSTAALA
jgi:LacI family transcriptional regulator